LNIIKTHYYIFSLNKKLTNIFITLNIIMITDNNLLEQKPIKKFIEIIIEGNKNTDILVADLIEPSKLEELSIKVSKKELIDETII